MESAAVFASKPPQNWGPFLKWKTIHCKKNLQNSCIFFYQTFQKRENPYADKGFFGALQRRNFLSFEEGKVFLSLQG